MADAFPIGYELPGTRPTHTPDGHRIAVCRPMNHRQQWEEVALLARVGNGLVRVRVLDSERWFACPPWRLSDPANRRRPFTRNDVADLPWEGAGSDPLLPAGDSDLASSPNRASPHSAERTREPQR